MTRQQLEDMIELQIHEARQQPNEVPCKAYVKEAMHLIDEYVAGVMPEKNEVPVKTYQEAKDLIRAGKSGQAIIMVHNATVDIMRRRAEIGEKQ